MSRMADHRYAPDMGSGGRTWAVGTASILGAMCLVTVLGSSAQAGDSTVSTCSSSVLSAKQTGSGAGMSQPYSQITVTNTSSTACALGGYPSITRMWTKSGRKAITVKRGSLGNMTDPGASRFVLGPGGHAWFAIGAATAYDPPLVTFTRVAFSTSSGATVAASVISTMQLPATAPTGKPFPIGVTAFAPGSNP